MEDLLPFIVQYVDVGTLGLLHHASPTTRALALPRMIALGQRATAVRNYARCVQQITHMEARVSQDTQHRTCLNTGMAVTTKHMFTKAITAQYKFQIVITVRHSTPDKNRKFVSRPRGVDKSVLLEESEVVGALGEEWQMITIPTLGIDQGGTAVIMIADMLARSSRVRKLYQAAQ
jgi:hypothetical protein